MIVDPMNLPKTEVTVKMICFHSYGDFCYLINGYLVMTVHQIAERQTAIILCNNNISHIAVIISQSPEKMFENIDPEELIISGG